MSAGFPYLRSIPKFRLAPESQDRDAELLPVIAEITSCDLWLRVAPHIRHWQVHQWLAYLNAEN